MKRSPWTRKPSVNLSESISRQLNMYALAARAAGVGILVGAQPAQAEIVYIPAHVKMKKGSRRYPIDLNHDGIVDFRMRFIAQCHNGCTEQLAIEPENPGNQAAGVFRHFVDPLHFGGRIGNFRYFGTSNQVMGGWESSTGTPYWFGPWANGETA
jgi:hypothetical protein